MKTSLYRHYNSSDELLYVGISLSALQRLGQHAEHSAWFGSISRVTIEHYETRQLALDAEREAVIRERPLHNVHHKKSAEEARRNATKELMATAQAKKDLTARITYLNPVYSLHAAADALSVSVRQVRQLVKDGSIGYFTMPTKTGKLVEYISGWQLIEYIENRMLVTRESREVTVCHA